MKDEHYYYLRNTYSQLLKHSSIECDDGWFNILDKLCGNIQSYISGRRKARAQSIKWNRNLLKAINDNSLESFAEKVYSNFKSPYKEDRIKELLDDPEKFLKDVPDKIHKAEVTQIKEKFATLRFYIDSSDPYINGLIQMAESMTETTCAVCGNLGKIRGDHWIYVSCEEHKRDKEI